jgi:voltage-gated potassium channel
MIISYTYMEPNSKDKSQLSLLNLVVFVLSVYVLLALLIDTLWVLPKETSVLLNYIDNTICVFFCVEFWIRFYQSDNKLNFIKWGWIDLISSIPAISYLRAGRVLRLIRLLRLIRAFRSTRMFVTHIFKNKAQGAFTSVSILACLLIIFSSIAILQVEKDPESNIKQQKMQYGGRMLQLLQ